MRKAGLPEEVVDLVGDTWRSHSRILTFEGVAADQLPLPPAGRALGLVCAPVLHKLAHDLGEAQKQPTYIDDRAAGAAELAALGATLEEWAAFKEVAG
eukprot:12277339-Alexandrium_andersonii.AAC.1